MSRIERFFLFHLTFNLIRSGKYLESNEIKVIGIFFKKFKMTGEKIMVGINDAESAKNYYSLRIFNSRRTVFFFFLFRNKVFNPTDHSA